MQLEWTDVALADLDHVEAYIVKDNSPMVAVDVVLRIIDTIENVLSEHPNAGRFGSVLDTRELAIPGTPYLVVYRVTVAVEIPRILHGAQQWPPVDQQ